MPLAGPYFRVVSEPDSDASLVSPFPTTQNFDVVQPTGIAVITSCSVPDATLTLRALFYGRDGTLVGVSQSLTLTSNATTDYEGSFLGTPSVQPPVLALNPVTVAGVALVSTAVSDGTWTISANLVGGQSI
jgi:hypothetical protein